MDEAPKESASVSPATPVPRLGLAIASLVLGILAVTMSLFLFGGLLGVVGLILGWGHLRSKREDPAMARWGIGLSILGLLLSLGLGVWYYHLYKEASAALTGESSSDQGLDTDAWRGVPAPDITVTTLDGKTIQLSKLHGKRVALDFWATWCPPCRKEIPDFIRLYQETSRDQLEIVGISSEAAGTLTAFVKKNAINYPIASESDKKLPVPYSQIQSIPTTFFIDRNGIIQSVVVGSHDFEELKQRALADDWKGQPKSPPSTVTNKVAAVLSTNLSSSTN